jgi:phenylpropionate dioxygenase-like ring-hydroxylating dioxygenase large terminal subunit
LHVIEGTKEQAMLAEENELLTQVDPGTPMGEMIRQYWIPAIRSDEISEADSAPLRIRLLSENLIAFRVTSGKVGVIQPVCAHRGASLFFGRNEQEGLRCVYHGWKFDVTGQCVDMPGELPENQGYKDRVRAKTYPTAERGGIVWVYMGPRETPPPLPDIEPNMRAGSINVQMMDCNWIQAIENNMDTVHIGFLHFGAVDPDASADWVDRRHGFRYMLEDRAPRFVVKESGDGAWYAAYRDAEADSYYYRMMMYHFPFFTQSPAANIERSCAYVMLVPLDNTHTMQWWLSTDSSRQSRPENEMAMLPSTTEWLGRFRPAVRMEDDMQIDRELQRNDTTWAGYTGIEKIPDQDRGITESQGGVQDRTIEHLAGSDAMIIQVRGMLLKAVKAFRDHGTTPPGVDEPELYRQRSGGVTLPRDVDIWEGTKELREAFHGVVVSELCLP